MFSKIGKLLTSDIKTLVLYEFTVNLIAAILRNIGDNSKVSDYVSAVVGALKILESTFSHERKSNFVGPMKKIHALRVDFLTAFRRQISVALKMSNSPSLVEAATSLKQKMIEFDWWEHYDPSYYEGTGIIRPLVALLETEPYVQWVTDISLQPIVEGLKKSQEDFEALKLNRIEERNAAITPQQQMVCRNLIEELMTLLNVIDARARHEPETFEVVAGEIAKMIIATNVITKTQQTLAEKEKVSEEEPILDSPIEIPEATDLESSSNTSDTSEFSGNEESNSGIRPGEDTTVGQT